jgi:hemoglobin-like flavoprotein
MVEISYHTVIEVSLSWDKLKLVKGYQEKAGDLIFARLFEIEPSAREIFKFTRDEDIRQNPKFSMHAKAMVDMIDCAVALLGPDLEPLKEDLLRLGRRHVNYGVQAKFLPVMEKAVIYALEEILGSKFTRNERNNWQIVFYYMIMQMTEGMES